MKKMLPLFLMVAGVENAQAQQTRGKSVLEYTTPLGTTFHKGDTLTFGLGQREDGSFRYANIAPNMMTPQGMAVPRSWANLRAVIKDLKETGTTAGLRVVAVFKSGIYNATLELASAEQAGEIKTIRNQQKATPASGNGVADELLKLKSLLDAGVLTQAEFDVQKTKLLAR